MNCENRGKFGHKVGRPSRKMYEALDKRQDFDSDPHQRLRELASVNIWEVDPELVSEFDEAVPEKTMRLGEWIPFIFKCDGMIVQMSGLDRHKTGLGISSCGNG